MGQVDTPTPESGRLFFQIIAGCISQAIAHLARVFFTWRKTMPSTAQQLLQILPNTGQATGVFAPVLSTAMNHHQIVDLKRAYESDQCRYVRGLGSDQCLNIRQRLTVTDRHCTTEVCSRSLVGPIT